MVIVVVAIAADGFVLFFIWSSSCFRSKGLSYEYMSKLRYISLCGSAGILLLLLSGVGCKTIGQNSIFVLWMTLANGHFYCATVEQLSENVSVVLCKKIECVCNILRVGGVSVRSGRSTSHLLPDYHSRSFLSNAIFCSAYLWHTIKW